MGRTIELRWNCRDCDSKGILGRHKKCPNCGSPREKGEMKMEGLGSDSYDSSGRNKAASVTDQNLLRMAVAGPDWFCSHCSCGNYGEGSRCSGCGAARYRIAEEDHPEFKGDHKRISEPSSETDSVEEAWARVQADAHTSSMSAMEEAWARIQEDAAKNPPPPPPIKTWAERYRSHLIAGSGFLLFIGLLCFVIWALQTHEVRGKVAQMSWDRLVEVERWTDTTTRLWKHQTSEKSEVPPRNGSGERAGLALISSSCRQEHFDDERYVCGNHEECEDIYRTERESYSCTKSERYVCGETCRDGGNGFAHCSDKYCSRSVPDTCSRSKRVFDHKSCKTVNDYCTRPIFKDKCDYMTQEWHTSGRYPTIGEGKEFLWGTEPSGDEVRRFYTANYKVKVAYEDRGTPDTYVITTSRSRVSKRNAEEASVSYRSWEVGYPVAMEVNNLGGVHSANHPALPELLER